MDLAKKRLQWAAVVLMMGMARSAEAGLITDGGFVTPGANPGTYKQYFGGDNFGGWTVTGADVLVLNTTYTETDITFNAQEGSNALDITGAGNTSPNDGVYRNIDTVSGQKYAISFYVGRATDSPASGRYSTPSSIGLSLAGFDASTSDFSEFFAGTYTNDRNPVDYGSVGKVNWKLFTTTFVAISSRTRVAFINKTAGPPSGNNYAGLDAVGVVATPEPGTIALAASALPVGLGLWLRRRRKAAIFAADITI